MAVVVPLLAGVGAGALTYAATASAVASTVVGVGTAVAVNSMMNQSQPQAMAVPTVPTVPTVVLDPTEVDTSSPTGGSATTINDVVGVQDDVASRADTSVDRTIYTPYTYAGTAAGGAATASAARAVSQGPAEDEAISFYEKGRRSTILTTAQGLLSEASGSDSMLRSRRGLVGQGLIA
jgi:hypothetical protein